MTRLASIMGVATVATIVLLSGCEPPTKTDYAKDLEGTWTATLDVPVPQAPTTTVMTPVAANVTRTDTNKGTVTITITNPTGPVSVMGSIEVTATEIIATDVEVTPEALLANLPPQVAAGLMAGVTLTYELSDDGSELTVEETTLFGALLGPANTKIKLTKQ